jgi:HTH-type transcriptional repressor of NAD biosynthesis genes
MKTGLIIGKFMPFHEGHISLINFGLHNCDKLIVAVCSLKSEPIDGNLRFKWVLDYFSGNDRVNVMHIIEELPGDSESNREISKIWADYLKVLLPEVNIIFASEQYAQYVAEYMNIDYIIYDIDRSFVPISATKIRENPFKYWDYIPNIVKPYYIKTVCIYGGESCGKTTIVKRLANRFMTSYVPEMARYIGEFSNINWKDFDKNFFIAFAKSHYDMINAMKLVANKILFVDSDNLTTQIYADTYIGMKNNLISVYDKVDYDIYFLMKPDIPFIQDGTRRYEYERWEIHNRFKEELIKNNIKYIEVGGSWDERFEQIISYINEKYSI